MKAVQQKEPFFLDLYNSDKPKYPLTLAVRMNNFI